jgi:hypothetical protein
MKKTKVAVITALIVILLSACNLPVKAVTPTTSPEQVGTAAALTVQAMISTQAATIAATQAPTNTQAPQPTAAATATLAPTQAAAPSNTPLPKATAGPLDKLGQVTDVNYPDNTGVTAGASFTKVWRLKNVGTTTWTTSYAVVFIQGDAMDAPASVALPGNVPPGGEVEVSVQLKAPTASKTYTGYWKLRNASGAIFGWGAAADQPFWVKVVVGKPTATGTKTSSASFAVTSITTSADPSDYSGTCPHDIKFTAKIKTSAKGTVKYHWEFSDGSSSSVKSLDYSEAGTKTVTVTKEFGESSGDFAGSAYVFVDSPNHQAFDFSKVDFTLSCAP